MACKKRSALTRRLTPLGSPVLPYFELGPNVCIGDSAKCAFAVRSCFCLFSTMNFKGATANPTDYDRAPSRSHGLRGNAVFDALRRVGQSWAEIVSGHLSPTRRRASKTAFPRGPWERDGARSYSTISHSISSFPMWKRSFSV